MKFTNIYIEPSRPFKDCTHLNSHTFEPDFILP